MDRLHQRVLAHRLDDIAADVERDGSLDDRFLAVSCDHDEADIGGHLAVLPGADRTQQLDAGHIRHAVVADDAIELLALIGHDIERRQRTGGLDDAADAGHTQNGVDKFEQRPVIVDDKKAQTIEGHHY